MAVKKTISAFTIMPFGNNCEYRDGNKESNYVYNKIIIPGIEKAFEREKDKVELKITREVDKNLSGSITSEIVKSLAGADIVVADITGRNANVFLELGIRYTLRNKLTILIAQHGTTPPFDVNQYRTVFYRVVEPEYAIQQIAKTITEGYLSERKSDSLVFETFSEINVRIPDYCESSGNEKFSKKNAMLWSEYWNRIEEICSLLEEPTANGQFTPDAIIGISNGGLVVADLIGRTLFRGKPILSLWANRFSRPHQAEVNDSYWFFDNDYNHAIVDVIKNKVKTRKTVILMLDDHLGTGTTVRQAESYLKTKFNNKIDILFIPMFSNRPEYIDVVEELFPYKFDNGNIFNKATREGFLKSLRTKASTFPYIKEISSGP